MAGVMSDAYLERDASPSAWLNHAPIPGPQFRLVLKKIVEARWFLMTRYPPAAE
jgi:hypothetical protein